eukprot:Gb_20834 [translate_table: standard]
MWGELSVVVKRTRTFAVTAGRPVVAASTVKCERGAAGRSSMAKAVIGVQWLEIAPPRMVCLAKRPMLKTLDTIAEESGLSNGEVMEGLQCAFDKACSLQLECKNERLAEEF